MIYAIFAGIASAITAKWFGLPAFGVKYWTVYAIMIIPYFIGLFVGYFGRKEC